MGQNISSNNLNENKLINKSSFIDELLGDKIINKQNSAKNTNSIEMIVTKKLITTTTTTSSAATTVQPLLASKTTTTTTTTSAVESETAPATTIITAEIPESNSETDLSALIDDNSKNENKNINDNNNNSNLKAGTSTIIKKEQLEYEFHIKPPKNKKASKKKSKKKKQNLIDDPNTIQTASIRNVRNDNFFNFFTSCVNTHNNSDSNELTSKNRKSTTGCGCFSKFSKFKNYTSTNSNNNLNNNDNGKSKLLESNHSPIKSNKDNNINHCKKNDDDDYLDPPPVRYIRVLRPSNDLTPVQFDSHYNIIQALNGCLNVNGGETENSEITTEDNDIATIS